MIEKDYIIVGQGLAGTTLCQTLLKQEKSVIIIDKRDLSQASRIAAGLYNPVVFKRLVKSWMADELVSFMDAFYTDAEQLLNTTFIIKNRLFGSFLKSRKKNYGSKKQKNL